MAADDTPKRNVIWIFGDQHPRHALGCNGNPNLNTPNLDIMATLGMNVTGAVGGMPLCCPFRGSLITSQYPHKCVPGHEYPLPDDAKTIAHAFKDNGYETAYFGKWHLDGYHEYKGRATFHKVPKERRGGFDTWIGFDNNNSQWDTWVQGHHVEKGEVELHRLPGYETDSLTDMLVEYIHRMGTMRANGEDKGFFAALSVQPPHNPYVAPEEWMQRHTPGGVELRPNVPRFPRVEDQARRDLAGAYAMIENLDWNVGRVRQALTETGLLEDTHILFFSDHGDMHGSHGQFKKMTPYEESIGIPFIFGGGRDQYTFRGGRNNTPINHVDIAPTSLGLCGLDVPDWMEGTDYSSLRDPSRPKVEFPDSAYLQSVIPTGHGNAVDRPWRGIVTADGWKYVCLEGQPWLMFNLNEDLYEQANMAHNLAFRGQRKKLHDRLARWIADTDDEFNLPEGGGPL
jgi:arylsulfatase A-like enzyme